MELWDIIDGAGNPLGRTITRGQALQAGEYHLVVHLWIPDDDGRYLIQRRAEHLAWIPGKWATTGGSALAGEGSRDAALRELHEELGIAADPTLMRRIARLCRNDNVVDLWQVAGVNAHTRVTLNDEVCAVQWVTPEELRRMVASGDFYNYGDDYFRAVLHGEKSV